MAERPVAQQLASVEPMVRGICRARLGAVDGDDAAQRTMLALWRRLEAANRQPIESLPTYAAVRARYEVLASLEQFGRRPTVAIGEAAEWACVDDAPGPEAHAVRAVEQAEAAARVEQLLAVLTPREVEVLRATKLSDTDTDTATAARALGITPSSVRTIQGRAIARLREACGTRSPNPLASNVPYSDRCKASWAARKAARRARLADHTPPQPGPAQVEFADDFRLHRHERGLSQSQLAAALGYDGSYVSKVERGKTWPSREFARRVDAVLATGETFQNRHGRHSVETTRADAERAAGAAEPDDMAGAGPLASRSTDTEVSAAELTRATDRGTDETSTDGSSADPGSAAAACAVARGAVRAAVVRVCVDAQDDERAGQLARWHADDHRADLDPDGWNETAGDDVEWRAADRDEAEAVAS
jgi:RNA polymerase sigma factor (sigma-70 family)